jgi:hypothetical protein
MASLPELLAELERSASWIAETLAQYPASRLNDPPPGGGWSAGSIMEHLCLAEEAINWLLIGNCEPALRPPDEQVQRIRSTFEDDTLRLQAGGPLMPGPEPKTHAIAARFEEARSATVSLLHLHDPDELCLSFTHAIFGQLTRLEWGYFALYHGERHGRQLERLRSLL